MWLVINLLNESKCAWNSELYCHAFYVNGKCLTKTTINSILMNAINTAILYLWNTRARIWENNSTIALKYLQFFSLNFVMLLADEQNVCRLQRSLVGSPCSHHHRKSVAIVYFNVFFHHFALLYPLSANILIIVQMACVCVNDSARKSLLWRD